MSLPPCTRHETTNLVLDWHARRFADDIFEYGLTAHEVTAICADLAREALHYAAEISRASAERNLAYEADWGASYERDVDRHDRQYREAAE